MRYDAGDRTFYDAIKVDGIVDSVDYEKSFICPAGLDPGSKRTVMTAKTPICYSGMFWLEVSTLQRQGINSAPTQE